MKILQREVPGFFWKLTFHMNKAFNHGASVWSYHLLMRQNFDPVGFNLLYTTTSRLSNHLCLTFWVVAYRRFDCIQFILRWCCYVYQHVDCVMICILPQVSFNLLVGHVLWQSWETGLENQGSYLDWLQYYCKIRHFVVLIVWLSRWGTGDWYFNNLSRVHLQNQVSVDDVLSLVLWKWLVS